MWIRHIICFCLAFIDTKVLLYIYLLFVFIPKKTPTKVSWKVKRIHYPNRFHLLELKIGKTSWRQSHIVSINVKAVSIYSSVNLIFKFSGTKHYKKLFRKTKISPLQSLILHICKPYVQKEGTPGSAPGPHTRGRWAWDCKAKCSDEQQTSGRTVVMNTLRRGFGILTLRNQNCRRFKEYRFDVFSIAFNIALSTRQILF